VPIFLLKPGTDVQVPRMTAILHRISPTAHVELAAIEPAIWRRLVVSSTFNLHRLDRIL
jgi:hypothetical protein